MKKFRSLFRILFFLAIISAVSCEKIIDFLPDKPKNCRIKRIHIFQGYPDYYGEFYYNKWGNPDSVIFGYVYDGQPNLLLKYNNRRQLIQAKYAYSNVFYETWHKFGYANGFITTDTVYVWGSNEEPEPLYYYDKYIMHIEYDNFGRIIKETKVQIAHPEYPNHVFGDYSYDTNGNKISGQTLSYDNYKNIHTLHPIWQFLDRDYSLNNPIPATSYNNFRLPLTFDQSHPPGSFARYHFLYRSLEKATIEYDCK